MSRHIEKFTGRIHHSSQSARRDGIRSRKRGQCTRVFIHSEGSNGVARRAAHGIEKSALRVKGEALHSLWQRNGRNDRGAAQCASDWIDFVDGDLIGSGAVGYI